MAVRAVLSCRYRRVRGEIVPLVPGSHGPHQWSRHGEILHCEGESVMKRESDAWVRVELFERGRWVPAPSPVAENAAADFDAEDDARAFAEARYPGQEWSWFRAPVRGQWRIRRVHGLA